MIAILAGGIGSGPRCATSPSLSSAANCHPPVRLDIRTAVLWQVMPPEMVDMAEVFDLVFQDRQIIHYFLPKVCVITV